MLKKSLTCYLHHQIFQYVCQKTQGYFLCNDSINFKLKYCYRTLVWRFSNQKPIMEKQVSLERKDALIRKGGNLGRMS